MLLARFEKGGRSHGVIQKHPELAGPVFSLSESVAWLESLMAALDCYVWTLGEQLIAPSEVFTGEERANGQIAALLNTCTLSTPQ